ncbi:MAG TPA: hypothetical protein VHW69_09695 [Rhizomicrobium sp.]|jgi:hypothetical protein|nr:hypothetical protein [Rhizomicrobium sp.]
MNKLTQTLLTGSALCALGVAPANAQPMHPAMHVTALHAGHVINKTTLPRAGDCNIHRDTCYYTASIYTSKPADARKSDLYGTYYRWDGTVSGMNTLCSHLRQHIKVPRRSVYAKIDKGTETYSYGCPSGPTVFYGDRWTNITGVPGDVDTFRSSLIAHWKHGYRKFKGTFYFDVNVSITAPHKHR